MEQRDEFIKKNQEKFENAFRKFIGIKSLSVTGENITEAVDFVVNLLRGLNAEVQVIQTAGHPIILANLKGKTDKNILFYGHYDVMSPGDLKEWTSDPFSLTKRQDRFFARGAGDNKGQLLAQIFGVYTYLQTHSQLPFNVTFFIEGEEEQGSPNLLATVKKLSKTKLNSIDLVVVVDGSANPDGTNVLRLGNRGIFAFELTAKTGQHDNHSGSFGNIMQNPVTLLINELDKIYDRQTGHVKIPHFYDGIEPPTKQEQKWLMELPFDKQQICQQAGINDLPMDQETYYQKLMFEPSFNIFSMKAGYMGQGVKTSIPHQASLKVDCRLVEAQDIATIKANLLKVYRTEIDRNNLEVKIIGELPPEKTVAKASQIAWLKKAIKQATGKVYIEPVMPGSVPNYVWKNALNVPVFTIPYANADEHNHDIDENITIKNFYNGIRISYEILNCAN
ncbi:M20/M25/M40 family metallo-hydrolase [Companilactobacillus sp. HBUAS59544]|uniref:M20/M25/M40 family metallo-hydrolase n=1 Tax=Companilactobacillus sp. HBUAS59544 TaxID=3109363 RepID=UPI002FF3752B